MSTPRNTSKISLSSRTTSSPSSKSKVEIPKPVLLQPTIFNKSLKAIENYKHDKNDLVSLKDEIKIKINMYSIGFFCIFLILIISTSSIIIDKYNKICDEKPDQKNEMKVIYGIAMLNIILTFLFIVSLVIIFYNIKVDFVIKNKNYIVYILVLLISIFNMSINSRFIKILNICYSDSEKHSINWLWINYALTLPICLLVIILYYLYEKFKLENWKFS
jgi:hypothetical protein